MKKTKDNFNEVSDDAGKAILLQNFTLYSIYRKLIGLSVLATVLLVCNIFGLLAFTNEEVEPRYTSLSESGSIYKEVALSDPYVSEADLLKNAQDVVELLNTYDYLNYHKQVPKAEEFFSPQGWKTYQEAMEASKNMELVKAENAIVSIKIEGSPYVSRKRVNPRGIYEWEVIVPASLIYSLHSGKNFGNERKQTGEFELRYVRATLAQTPRQFAISMVQFRPTKR